MTRPGFLVITAIGCALGMATAVASGGGFSWPRALATWALALLAHASANMQNDYADALNGADAANSAGLYPFTGGSRLVQRGVVAAADMRQFSLVLAIVVVLGGIWLAVHSGGGLLVIGLVGLLLGWAYSLPPLALMKRGWGEVSVALAWALVVVGADHVQRGRFFLVPAAAALGYGLMIGNILLANAFPDAAADARVGKRTLAVRLGLRRAAWLYLAVAVAAQAWVLALVVAGVLPRPTLAALAAAPLSLAAGALLLRHASEPTRLRAALVLGIAAAAVYGLGMTWGFWMVRAQGVHF
ncbi:MAG: prenyltransferase [Giesbergeria sp.]|nr:prenyltransferase [Giesbergeria sp.]MBP6161095.1 prenyltransferase [Giesbergeria sp.]MBP7085124.1 prenyltransferase [Giesbergeria sp.]MBP9784513.1 prenyltransferase [Giesbergeria sp.]MBP9895939.1 prenyltransferase [Giesbergeria sp.]